MLRLKRILLDHVLTTKWQFPETSPSSVSAHRIAGESSCIRTCPCNIDCLYDDEQNNCSYRGTILHFIAIYATP